MYAMQYGDLIYFNETTESIFNVDPDVMIEIDKIPACSSNEYLRINSETKMLEIIQMKIPETTVIEDNDFLSALQKVVDNV